MTSEPITVKFEKPDVAVPAGTPLKLIVRYAGKPAPKLSWTLNDEPVTDSKRLKIEDKPKDGTATLTISKSESGDSGKYVVKVRNDTGELTAEANVSVLSKPSAPKELTVNDVTATSLTLAWTPPDDAVGGNKIKMRYIIEKRAANRTVWQKVSTTPETNYTVEDLTPGTKYLFRVAAENSQGPGEPTEVGPISLKEEVKGKT